MDFSKYIEERDKLIADPSMQRLGVEDQFLRLLTFTNECYAQMVLDPNDAKAISHLAYGYYKIGQFGRSIGLCFRILMFLDDTDIRTKESVLDVLTWSVDGWDSIIAAPYLVKKILKKHANGPLRTRLEAMYRKLCERTYQRRKEAQVESQNGVMITGNGGGEEFQDPKVALNAKIDAWVDHKCMLSLSARTGHRQHSNILPEVAKMLNGTGVEARVTEKGIGLFARRDFKEGDTILQDCNSIWGHHDPSRCHHCCRLPKKTLKCQNSQCSRVFCSKLCQDAAQAYHTAFCGADWKDLQEILDSSYSTRQRGVTVQLKIAGLFAKQRKEGSNLRPADQTPLHIYSRLTDGSQQCFRVSEMTLRNWAVLCCMTVDNDLRIDPLYDFESYLQLESIFETNSFSAYCGDPSWRGSATALGIVATFFNHSCDPNVGGPTAEHFYAGKPVLTFVAKQAIQKGTELTKSYVDSELSVTERLFILKKQYGFSCTCDKCKRESQQDFVSRVSGSN